MNKIEQIRQAFADYYASEGCSCCQQKEAHDAAKEKLAALLDVPPFDDGNGFHFWLFRTKEEKQPCVNSKKVPLS